MSIKSKTIHKLQHIAKTAMHGIRQDQILSTAEAAERMMLLSDRGISYTVDRKSKTLFFTKGHGFGYPHMPDSFVPVTQYRKGDSPWTVDTILSDFQDYTVVNDIEELATRMDEFYPEFGHIKKAGEFNWQPEHFPAGTVVELSNYFYSEETGEVVHSKRDDSYAPLTVTVKEVTKNGIDSYCIITEENRNKFPSGFDVYNFHHVGRIVSRGTGQVVWQKSTREQYFEKNTIGSAASKKSHYYWSDVRILIPHLLSSIPGAANKMLTDKFITDIAAQTFVKTVKLFDFYTVKHAPKKKLKAFVRKNWPRWVMNAGQIRKEEQAHQDEMERIYSEDMERELDRDLKSLEVITRGINDHGNNQEYLDGEPICGNCKSSYVNRGGDVPLGMGMHCMNCQNEDPVDYHDGDGCFPVTSIGMPALEQVQADASSTANIGEPDISSV